MNNELIRPDYLFEVSWEVCNKVGGIYTVLATKSLYLKTELKRHHILVGPDVWMDTESNPDFIEDPLLYRDWKAQAAAEGLRLRVGRWNIQGQPTAILVDFKQFLTNQNNILTEYWKRFGVDSLTGNWDYKESALFGYAAGKVLPLYDSMSLYDGDSKAREFNVLARHSLETKSAQNADIFTTVSEITASECKQFLQRDVDIITPNGFENDFTPATDEEYMQLRSAARAKLVEVATAMSGETVPDNSIFVGIGGRYEWRNKGIDVFIDALDSLNRSSFEGKSIQAFIFIPSGNNGPDKELVAKLAGTGSATYVTRTSHYLIDPEYDIISRRLNELNFKNAVGDKECCRRQGQGIFHPVIPQWQRWGVRHDIL